MKDRNGFYGDSAVQFGWVVGWHRDKLVTASQIVLEGQREAESGIDALFVLVSSSTGFCSRLPSMSNVHVCDRLPHSSSRLPAAAHRR